MKKNKLIFRDSTLKICCQKQILEKEALTNINVWIETVKKTYTKFKELNLHPQLQYQNGQNQLQYHTCQLHNLVARLNKNLWDTV